MAPSNSSAATPLAIGTKCWVQDETTTWVKGQVTGHDGELVIVSTAKGQHRVPASAAPMQNADEEPVEDMTDMVFLHEPGVLWNLKQRYSSNAIYTYTGSILIAVNPFQQLPELYGKSVMDAYSGGDPSGLPPHVYAIASAAYKKMRSEGKGQAILVTGESGAGKTETSKLIMRYLAYLGGFKQSTWDLAGAAAEAEAAEAAAAAAGGGGRGSTSGGGSNNSIEHKVLESNPLLEAFGNAKTVRNDNSSRFGKYVQINFNARGAISGAAIRTYLLERSRLVHLNPGERNYHIFYQLCDGATPEERQRWLLQPPQSYTYLNQSDVYTLPGVDNAHEFAHTRHAMTSIGISEQQQDQIFRVLSALLHLGNISWQDSHSHGGSSGEHTSSSSSDLCNGTAEAAAAAAAAGGCPLTPGPQSPAALAAAATLMGCDAGALARALSTRTRATPDGPITSPLDAAAAGSNRDALIKVMYSRIFDWLVSRINASIGQDPNAFASIGLLDIYGFESFTFNDLEQFCINLANEKLQQHFNQHVFKWEQAEYEAEGIDWSYIEFVDNQDVLDLIEGKLGIVDLLDEQCRFPTATARDLGDKLFAAPAVSTSERFSRTKRSTSAFTLQHYAGPVSYSLDNFLDKNKDYVVAEHASLLSGAGCQLLADLFGEGESAGAAGAGAGGGLQNGRTGSSGALAGKSLKAFQFVSVCSHFKKQLTELMALLNQLEPHYVRCIKPNPGSKPLQLEDTYALHQLKCGGVMEAVRISCAGYPFRRTFEDFMRTYWQLYPSGRFAAQQSQQAATDACRALLKGCGLSEGADYQIGSTKVFLKSHQAATLARLHTAALSAAATRIQSEWRGAQARAQFNATRAAVVKLQAGARGMAARRLAERLRQEQAATALQREWRARSARVAYQQQQQAALVLQALLRALAARQLYAGMLAAHRAAAATKVQAGWRGRSARQAYAAQQQAAVVLQNSWRVAVARQQYKELRHQSRAARTIQKAWRKHKQPAGWGMYPGGVEAVDAAARTIQTIWRERDQHNSRVKRLQAAVRQYVQLHGAAVVLQRSWRCHAAHKAFNRMQEQQRRAAFRQQMKLFEQQAQQQQQHDARGPAGGASSTRRFFSDTDSTMMAAAGGALSPRSPSGIINSCSSSSGSSRVHGGAPGHFVQGLMAAVPKPVGTGIQFAGLPRAGQAAASRRESLNSNNTPVSPGGSENPFGDTSPKKAPSPSGSRSSWVLPPPPPAGYGIGYEGINRDRNPLKPGVVAQQQDGSSSGQQQQTRSSRALKLFAPPPPAAYGVTFPGTQGSSSSNGSSSDNSNRVTDGGVTCVRARLLEPAPPAAYGVQYAGYGGGSSSRPAATVVGRPRLWLGNSSSSSSSGQASPGKALMNGLKRMGSSIGRNSSSSATASPGDEDKSLLLGQDEEDSSSYGYGYGGRSDDVVRSDDLSALPPQERLETRLGGLREGNKGMVSNLASAFKRMSSST